MRRPSVDAQMILRCSLPLRRPKVDELDLTLLCRLRQHGLIEASHHGV